MQFSWKCFKRAFDPVSVSYDPGGVFGPGTRYCSSVPGTRYRLSGNNACEHTAV